MPVLEIDGDLVVTDGHTRAFLAYLSGATELSVTRDPDRADLDLALYRECVRWCRQESVTRVSDLAGRVVSPAAFRECWIARVQEASHDGAH